MKNSFIKYIKKYFRNRLKNTAGHPGVHPGTGQGGEAPPPPGHGQGPAGRRTPPIRPAVDVTDL